MHGAEDRFVVDIADEAVIVHFFEKGFAPVFVFGNRSINQRDDVFQCGACRCAALRWEGAGKLLGGAASFK